MPKKLFLLLQYLIPHHLFSHLMGKLAECRWQWLKNSIIHYFINRYKIDLHTAQLEHIEEYPNFNSFFTRLLKPELRPIVQAAHQVACPVDGIVSQIGQIDENKIFQAKGFYYTLQALLGGSEQETQNFYQGKFATFYLAPKNYHRVHIPFTGHLRTTIYIPGKLFSVNQYIAQTIPHLFTRNERLVCLFDTNAGPMAVILVGAMQVGKIETVWSTDVSAKTILTQQHSPSLLLERGAELGHFKMGSTVIVLFAKGTIDWQEDLQENSVVQMGQGIGKIIVKNTKG